MWFITMYSGVTVTTNDRANTPGARVIATPNAFSGWWRFFEVMVTTPDTPSVLMLKGSLNSS